MDSWRTGLTRGGSWTGASEGKELVWQITEARGGTAVGGGDTEEGGEGGDSSEQGGLGGLTVS